MVLNVGGLGQGQEVGLSVESRPVPAARDEVETVQRDGTGR